MMTGSGMAEALPSRQPLLPREGAGLRRGPGGRTLEGFPLRHDLRELMGFRRPRACNTRTALHKRSPTREIALVRTGRHRIVRGAHPRVARRGERALARAAGRGGTWRQGEVLPTVPPRRDRTCWQQRPTVRVAVQEQSRSRTPELLHSP